jgi:hypothetical protein
VVQCSLAFNIIRLLVPVRVDGSAADRVGKSPPHAKLFHFRETQERSWALLTLHSLKLAVGFVPKVDLIYCGCATGGTAMPEQDLSAFAAMRALRDELRARLDQNEDYRAWKALDEALRQLEPRTLPQVVDFALSQMRTASGSREDEDALKAFEEQMRYRVASDPPKSL